MAKLLEYDIKLDEVFNIIFKTLTKTYIIFK